MKRQLLSLFGAPSRGVACFLTAALLLVATGCGDCNGDGPSESGPPSGDGILRVGGEERPYAVDFEASRLLILVKVKDQFGCGVFHSHAVEAESYALSFVLDADDPESSRVEMVAPAAGLNPDEDENRALFPETRDEMLSEDDRRRIRVSVLEELRAEEHPTLRFVATGLSTLEGEGTAELEVELVGETSTIPFSYTATFDEEGRIYVEGTGQLDGKPHGIPNPAGLVSDCVDPIMDLHLKLTLVPGASKEPPPVDGGPPFEEVFYPYDGGCGTVGFEEVRQIVGPRCVGCHMDPPRLGASTPLVTWEHFRVNAPRSPGAPLYETAGELVSLPFDATLHMPPADVSQLTNEEKERFLTWVEEGAPPEACEPVEVEPFEHTAEAPCGPLGYEEDVAPFVASLCFDCHFIAGSAIPLLDTYEAGLVESEHLF